jgi:hypothetical protein
VYRLAEKCDALEKETGGLSDASVELLQLKVWLLLFLCIFFSLSVTGCRQSANAQLAEELAAVTERKAALVSSMSSVSSVAENLRARIAALESQCEVNPAG